MIRLLGDLLLSKEYKSREIQRNMRTVFGEVAAMDANGEVGEYLKGRMVEGLKRFLQLMGSSMGKTGGDELKKAAVTIT